jgi:hypothetical protein
MLQFVENISLLFAKKEVTSKLSEILKSFAHTSEAVFVAFIEFPGVNDKAFNKVLSDELFIVIW